MSRVNTLLWSSHRLILNFFCDWIRLEVYELHLIQLNHGYKNFYMDIHTHRLSVVGIHTYTSKHNIFLAP